MKCTNEDILTAMQQIVDSGFIPTIRSVCRKVGLRSTSTASHHIRKLVAKKLVKRLKTFGGRSVYLPMTFACQPAFRVADLLEQQREVEKQNVDLWDQIQGLLSIRERALAAKNAYEPYRDKVEGEESSAYWTARNILGHD